MNLRPWSELGRDVVFRAGLCGMAMIALVLLPRVAEAQQAKTATEKKSAEPPPQVSDLNTRYRFLEQYVVENDKVKAKPGELSQYRVASRDVIKVSEEKPQGAPDVKEVTMQLIYAERPAALSTTGAVTDVVRRYEAVRYSPQAPNAANSPKLLEGLELWIRPRATAPPLMILLAETRRLSETEYSVNARQVFMPELAGILPAMPRRIGDKWPLARDAIDAMLGESPVKNAPLIAILKDIRKGTKAGELIAVISISGRVLLGPGIDTAVKAQALFTFTPPPASPAEAAPKADDDVIEVRGAITELRMAKSSVTPVPGGNGRLRRMFREELVLQRQLTPSSTTAPLIVPSPPPIATEANSWLTYDDPRGRFHFRHPQDLLPPTSMPPNANEVQLFDNQIGAMNGSIVTLILQPKTGDELADKNSLDPDFHMKDLNKEWAENKQDVLRGPAGWLPEEEWSPLNMRVHRIEARLKPSGPAGKNLDRIHLDYYLVLFTEKESLVVNAMTGQNDMRAFRKQVESILKTFKLGPSAPSAKGS